MLATLAPLPVGPDWVFEQKWDGARGLARVHGGGAQLFGRRGTHLSAMFPEIVEVLPAALGGRTAIVDGEIVALDHRARPSFSRLQRRLRSPRPRASLVSAVPAALFVFDVLHCGGRDVTGWPYTERRALLEDLGIGVAPPVLLSTGVAGRNRRHHPRCRG